MSSIRQIPSVDPRLTVVNSLPDPVAARLVRRWQLTGVIEMDYCEEVELTGGVVGGLHESILTMDPSGQEGCDLE